MKWNWYNNWTNKEGIRQFNLIPDISIAFEEKEFNHILFLWAGFVIMLYKDNNTKI